MAFASAGLVETGNTEPILIVEYPAYGSDEDFPVAAKNVLFSARAASGVTIVGVTDSQIVTPVQLRPGRYEIDINRAGDLLVAVYDHVREYPTASIRFGLYESKSAIYIDPKDGWEWLASEGTNLSMGALGVCSRNRS